MYIHSQTTDLANHVPAHYLPQADLILVLGDNGKVVKQGSYAQLRDDIASSIKLNNTHFTQVNGTETENSIDVLAEPPMPTLDTSSAPSPTDGGRQTTELATYKYYFSALGWSRIAVLLLFLATEAGMSGFRCKYNEIPNHALSTITA